MKTLQCPICGGELASAVTRYGFGYACWKCKWKTASFNPTEQIAKEAIQNLISKFPPIMRIWPGDNLKLDFEDDILTVIGKDTTRCKIYLENCYGNIETATPDDVDQWPWELERKGIHK